MTTFHINKSCRWRLKTDRPAYQDLVSDNNALLAVMRDKGLWQTYSGPRIRQTLQISKQTAQWYNGYDVLLNPAIDLFADAWFEPKMVVVPIILSKQEILNNQGEAQLMDVLDSYMAAAERALEDAMDSALHAAGGGKQLTGLATAIPIANTTGVYGGIDRAQNSLVADPALQRAHYMAGVTQVTSTTVRPHAQSDNDGAVARQGLRRSAPDVAAALRGLRRRDDRHPAADQRLAWQAWLLDA